jgi:hypothetical protein
MLKMPQRSVTRFFIPLIDVLTLLFCVFLIMPMARSGKEGANLPLTLEGQLKAREDEVLDLQEQLSDTRKRDDDTIAQLRKQLEEVRTQSSRDLARKLQVVFLSMDRDAKLFGPDGLEIGGADEAGVRLKKDRGKYPDRELLYLVRFPSDVENLSSDRREQIEGWFREATVQFAALPRASEREK